MNRMYAVAAAVGIVCGFISTRSLLAGTWWNVVFWALIGVSLGLFVHGRRDVRWTGIIYGIFLTLSFLLSGFQGTPDKLPEFFVLIAVLSIVGALCGWLVVFIGSLRHRK
jgi:hypothetical protein